MPDGPERGRYAAFICYSQKDQRSARRWQRRLQEFPIGKVLVGRESPAGPAPAEVGPLFMANATADAGTTIPVTTRDALDSADAMILLASPDAASSLRVNEEVRLFRHHHPDRPVIPLIVSSRARQPRGGMFPPALCFRLNSDGRVSRTASGTILATDERASGDGPDLALAKIVARLLGLEADEVYRADRARRRRARRRGIVAGVLVALSLGGGCAGWYVWQAEHSRAAIARQMAETERRAERLRGILVRLQGNGAASKGSVDDPDTFDEAARAIVADGAFSSVALKVSAQLEDGKPRDAAELLRAAAFAAATAPDGDKKRAALAWRTAGAVSGLVDAGQAREAFAAAIQKDPLDLEGLYRSGVFETLAGDLGQADMAWREVIRLGAAGKDDRKLWRAHIGLGDGAVPRGALDAAMAEFQQARTIAEARGKAPSEIDPDHPAWQKRLAASHDRLGILLLRLGKPPDAETAFRTSLSILDPLAKRAEDDLGLKRDVAISYDHIGDALAARGNRTEALKSWRAANSILSELAKSDPKNAAAQDDLAGSYNKIGDALAAAKNGPEALKAYNEGLAVRSALAAGDPTNVEWQRGLSVSNRRIGDQLASMGNPAEALKFYRNDLAIVERMAKTEPENAEFQASLAAAHLAVGDVLSGQNKWSDALKAYGVALNIRKQLAKAEPKNPAARHALATASLHVGNTLAAMGNPREAVRQYRDTLPALAAEAAAEPENAAPRRDLALMHARIGDLLMASGNQAEALKSFRESIVVMDWLAKLIAADPASQRDLAASYQKTGDALLSLGDSNEALKSFRASLGILERQVKSGTTVQRQHDMAASYGRIGDVLMAQQKSADALVYYREARAVLDRLAQAAPRNAAVQRDVALADQNIGVALVAQRNPPEALKSYQSGHVIFERLAKAAPNNTAAQHDVAVSWSKLGGAFVAAGALADGQNALRRGQAVMARLAQGAPDNPEWKKSLDWFNEQLAAFPK